MAIPAKDTPPFIVRGSMKLIGRYGTLMTWNYAEAPVDGRALDAMVAFDPALANKIRTKYMRKHGGLAGVIKNISSYDKFYGNFNKFDAQARYCWDLAQQDTRQFFFRLPHKASPCPYWYYRPAASNSGDPYYSNRREILDLIYEETGDLFEEIASTPERSFESYMAPPVVPFVKSVVSKTTYGPKTRAIWCYPAVMTCLESMFGTSLYHLMIQHRHTAQIPLMHGPSAFKDSRTFLRATDVGQGVRVSDWVKGDQQMPPWLIKRAFDILEELLDFNTVVGRPVSPNIAARNRRVFHYVRWYFINTPIVVLDWLYRKSGGIPSGSLFTLMVWNICSLLTNCYLSRIVENRQLTSRDVVVCGDDNAARVYTPGLTFANFARAGARCGLIFHGHPKSQLHYWPKHEQIVSLSSRYNEPAMLYRDEEDLLARFIYPQRWVQSREESIGRALMLDMSVLKSMPRVHSFVQFYLKHKPLRLNAPIYTDKDINKYFRYVADAPWLVFPDSCTLLDIIKPYANDFKWMFLFATSF